METYLHTPIPELCNTITHAKCLLAFISYLSMWIKAKHTFIKTARAVTAISPSKIWFMTGSGSVKTAKKSWTVTEWGHVTLNCVQTASKQAKVDFSSHICQFTRLPGVAVMQGLTFRDYVVTLFISARWYALSGIGFMVAHQLYIGNVMHECKIGKSGPHQACENHCHPKVFELSLLWITGLTFAK